jgi:hypothetical protein
VQPETQLEHGIDSEAAYKESGNEIPETKPVEVPEPKPEPVDVAEFTCKICGETYRISHVKPGVHELELMKQ